VAVRGHAQLTPRLNVVTPAGTRLSVSLSPTPEMLAVSHRETLSPASWQKLVQYITLNLPTLLAFWYGLLEKSALVKRLQRLEERQACR
jgi:hypothetical protein